MGSLPAVPRALVRAPRHSQGKPDVSVSTGPSPTVIVTKHTCTQTHALKSHACAGQGPPGPVCRSSGSGSSTHSALTPSNLSCPQGLPPQLPGEISGSSSTLGPVA